MRQRRMIRDDIWDKGYCRECLEFTTDIDTQDLCPECYYAMYETHEEPPL